MGIYDSGLSCWQRRKLGLSQDNAGKTVQQEEIPTPPVAEELVEEKKEEVVVKKPVPKRKPKAPIPPKRGAK